MPTWSLASLETDLRHTGIQSPAQISLWPNRPPPSLASGRASGSTIKGVFSKATDRPEKLEAEEAICSQASYKHIYYTLIMLLAWGWEERGCTATAGPCAHLKKAPFLPCICLVHDLCLLPATATPKPAHLICLLSIHGFE